MSDQTQVVTEQPKIGTEPQAGEDKFDAEYVRSLRAEAADYRKKLRELEGKVKGDEEAKLSETEKLSKKLAELEKHATESQKAMRERTLRYEVMLSAQKLGIVDPDAAYKLLDTSSLEFDEDGQPKDIEKALKALIVNKPYLAAGGGRSSATNPAGGTSKEIDPVILAARKAAGLS